MRPIEIDLPCTLEQAVLLDPDERELLGLGDVLIEPVEVSRLALNWAWLRGFSPESPEGQEVQERVRGDVPLMVALAQPAAEFVSWFRQQAWEEWPETEEAGDEDWAWDALQRARGAAAALGAMASQVALRPI